MKPAKTDMKSGRARVDTSSGYSLIELAVALAIMGILVSAAITGYGRYAVKAYRQDAVSLLSQNVMRLERCFTLEGVYNGSCRLMSTSEKGHYRLVDNRSAASYTLTAEPVSGGRQAADSDCGSFIITSAGDRTSSGTMNRQCW